MAKDKPQPQTGPEIEEYSTTATPKAYAGSVPVFCAHDAIVPLKDLRPNPKNPNQHPPEQIKLLASIIRAAGFGVKSEIVWDKGTPGMGVGWRSQHELILFGAKAATHFDGHKGYGNVLSISRSGNELHPTQKPVELLEKLVDNTDFATGVYDPFGGSGTTLAACEAYGQPSYIMELTPAFTDVIVKRYIRITGKTTVRCVRQGRELPREEIAAIFEPDEEGGEQE